MPFHKLQEKFAFSKNRAKRNNVRKKTTDLFGKIKDCPTDSRNCIISQELCVGRSVAVLYDAVFLLYTLVVQRNCAKKQYLYIDTEHIVIYTLCVQQCFWRKTVRRTFCKKEKEVIKRLVKKMDLELYRIRFSIGKCETSDVVVACDFLLERWNRIVRNRRGFFFTFFLGLARELVVEVRGGTCEPYLQLLCFADRKKALAEKEKIRYLAFLSWIRATRAAQIRQPVAVEWIPEEKVDKALDELMLPCVRVIRPNAELEEILDSYQYHRRLCSRSGIVSAKSLERYSEMER